MEQSSLLYFPSVIKYTHFVDNNGRFLFRILHLLKKAFVIFLAACIFKKFLNRKKDETSLGALHNGLIISLFLGTGLPMVAKRKQLLVLAKFIAEPVQDIFKSYRSLRQLKRFIHLANLYLVVISIYIIALGMILPVLPNVVSFLKGNVTSFGTDIWLLADTKSTWLFMFVNILVLIGYFFEMLFLGSWLILMSCLVLKFNLLVSLMVDRLANLDKSSIQSYNEKLISLVESSRLPLCQKCRVLQSPRESSSTTHLGPHECCVTAYRAQLTEQYYRNCLSQVIQQHQGILQFLKLLDTTFRLSVFVFSQICVITITTYFPKTEFREGDGSSTKMVLAVFEVFVGVFIQGLLSYWGQTVLDQSTSFQRALYLSSWPDGPVSFKRSLYVMQSMANRRMILTVGGLYTLNMENFAVYCWSVFSYAKIMQNLRKQIS